MSAVPAPTPAQRRRWPRITRKQRQTFLDCLAAGWSARHASEAAGRLWPRFYDLRHVDEAFAAEWDEALETGTQALADEARRRAVDGTPEPVYQRGELVGHVQRYSDNLLIFLLKARRPDVYRDSARVEVTGAGGGPIELQGDWKPATLEDVQRFALEHRLVDVIDGEATEVAELTEGEAS